MKCSIIPIIVSLLTLVSQNKSDGYLEEEEKWRDSEMSTDQFPYLASIVYISFRHDTPYMWICHSPIISDSWILTYEPCTKDLTYMLYAAPGVTFNDRHISEETLIFVKQDYVADAHRKMEKNNLVLLELEQKIVSDTIKPAALSRKPPDGMQITSIAMQQSRHTGIRSIKRVNLPIINQRRCKEKIKDACRLDYNLYTDNFCTDEPQEPGSRSDYYDTGSPVEVSPGIIVGIVTDFEMEEMDGCPGVHISIGDHEKFINETVPNVKWIG